MWLHYQQLCATGRGEDPYTSDLGQHLHFAQSGLIYSATSLLIGPAYAAGGKLGIALLLAVFHLAAVAVFAWGLKAALPGWSLPARLLASFVVDLAQAVYIPRGGYWYQGTVGGTLNAVGQHSAATIFVMHGILHIVLVGHMEHSFLLMGWCFFHRNGNAARRNRPESNKICPVRATPERFICCHCKAERRKTQSKSFLMKFKRFFEFEKSAQGYPKKKERTGP